ncbi:MAG: hypothetical protein IPN93_09330 [Bacteroidetes bacterium]|nr:hypothetical protein [Bacteroidota bacterium]
MKTSLCILFFLFIICGCSKPNKIINYNSKYINEIDSLSNISKELKNKYSFEYITIREFDSDIGIRVSVKDSIFSDCKYFEINILNPIKSDFDSLSVFENIDKNSLFSDKLLIEILRIYIKIKANAIYLNERGIFIALENAITINHDDVESGLFVPHSGEIDSFNIIEKIEDKKLVYEETIPH